MGRKRPDSGAPGHDDGEGPGQAGHVPPAGEERLGPLTIARHVKDDGRALILYTHAEREPA